MKSKTLVLLTKQFPFLNREQYVAHELEFLAKEFEKIYIYPHDHFRKDDQITFELPPNVEVINLNLQIPPIRNKFALLMSYLRAFVFELCRVHDRMWFVKNAKRFFSIYTTQYALGIGLMNFLAKKKLNQKEVVFYSYWFSASALCLSILKSRGEIDRYVSRAHALDLYHEDWGLLNERVGVLPFRNFKQKFVDVLYSISEHGKKYLEKKYPDIQSVKVAYLGVKDFGLNPGERSEEFVIVTCSGVDDNKRIHLLGNALSRIQQKVLWIHFGDGPLKDLALQSVTSSNVKFDYRGQTPNKEVREFYASNHVDLFVNLSKVEGLPVTIMEVLSHGIPVLATAANGTPEAVVDGETGQLLPINFSSGELDECLLYFLKQTDAANEMLHNCRLLFERKFNAESNYTFFAKSIISEAN